MARLDVNRSGEMEVFVRAVDLGGLSAAARAYGMTPSGVSKLIARLEARLHARLINRSTRKLQLTAEGCAFYERARRIIADLEEAERAAARGEQPAGRIRLNTSASYGAHVLAPILADFLTCHTGVTLDLVHTDTVVDLFEERTDVAIRAGPLGNSSLFARKLGETPMVIVAAPGYLARWGTPRTIEDLDKHNRLGLGYSRAVDGWPLQRDGASIILPPSGIVHASDGEAIRHLALGGIGLARLALFTVTRDIAAGRLVPLLADCNPGETETFHAVFLGRGGPLPARIRALLDFLAERGRVG